MKKSEMQKMAKKTIVDLRKDLDSAREELRSLRFDLATGKVKNIAKIHELKKTIARVMTLINQKQKDDGKDN